MYYSGSSLLNAAAPISPLTGLNYGAAPALNIAGAPALNVAAAQPWAAQLPIQTIAPAPQNSVQPFPANYCGGLQHFGSHLLGPQSFGGYPYAPYGAGFF